MNLKALLYCHLIVLVLLGTFFWPPTKAYWTVFDVAVFKFLNHTLLDRPWWQLFWACLNHKLADWIEDFIFICFCSYAVIKTAPQQQLKKACQFIVCILFAIPVIYLADRVICRELIDIYRISPSLVITPCVRLSHEIPWMKIKDSTHSCFPGGHAVTLLFFAISYTYLAGRKLGYYAIAYSFVRLLPRLIVGAHWLSDILVGSVSVALFALSWAYATPFHAWATAKIETLFQKIKRSYA